MNPYQILGVASSSTESEVKQAYRKSALLHHPDKAGPESTARFQTLRTAYEQIIEKGFATIKTSSATQTPERSHQSENERWGSHAYERWVESRTAKPVQRKWAGSFKRSRCGKSEVNASDAPSDMYSSSKKPPSRGTAAKATRVKESLADDEWQTGWEGFKRKP
ncbi:hypothetical protein LTR64_001281 [Lithohypha guttulata]|uniref:uncharacterized protein n=1 Tax=Lithohypha guttulata TaxID=1690604 RepID=UPI002DE0E9B9|nr:hypothetical protein LTR51_003475 [Lithohypha guttulata]